MIPRHRLRSLVSDGGCTSMWCCSGKEEGLVSGSMVSCSSNRSEMCCRMDLATVRCVVLVRSAAPSGSCCTSRAFICCDNMFGAGSHWARSWREEGLPTKSVSTSGLFLWPIGVFRTDCPALYGAAARRCTADPTPSPPSLSGTMKRRVDVSAYAS